jgi:hypothetical protein
MFNKFLKVAASPEVADPSKFYNCLKYAWHEIPPNFSASLESILKIMKNGFNNLFTAPLVPQVIVHFALCVMTSLVLKMIAKRRKSNISEVI